MKTSIKFIIATFVVLLIASLALNIYQLHLFANTELTGDGVIGSTEKNRVDSDDFNQQFSSFTSDINFRKDTYRPQKSTPYWIKSILATALNINLSRFDSQIKIFCYQVRSTNSNIRNCIDELKVWSISEDDTDEAYVAIIGKPAETAGTSIKDLCAEQPCNSYRLAHVVKKGESSSIIADTGFTLSEKDSKNISINLLKISQGGIPAWTVERTVPFKSNLLIEMSMHLSDGRKIRNIGDLIIDGTWIDGECLFDADTPTNAQNTCERQLEGNLKTDFKNSTYWYPANLVYNNQLNVKGSGIKLNFDIETQRYVIPERASSEIVQLIDQLSSSPTNNEEIPVLKEAE